MSKIIRVRFFDFIPEGAEELYQSVGLVKSFFYRKRTENDKEIVWVHAKKDTNGVFVPGNPVKADTTIRVMADKAKDAALLFEETMLSRSERPNDVSAERKSAYALDIIQSAVKEMALKYNLREYQDWEKWLLDKAPVHHYTGVPDNWLNFGTDMIDQEVLERFDVYGIPYLVTKTLWKHKVCGAGWSVFAIEDEKKLDYFLCGYKY